jgi:hypothetical protein
MTTHLTKIWWDLNKHKLVEQAIPEAEIYKREWVGLTDEEIIDVIHPLVMADMADEVTDYEIARAIEAKLKEKNT